MDQDGGLSKFPGNKAGAKYGTGYCDAQCPRDLKFINGEGNVEGWNTTGSDTGEGSFGSCCTEMDIWEANSISTALTAHACTGTGQTRCTGVQCGGGEHRFDGFCDQNGCDFQTFRLGEKDFYGPGSSFTIDTTKPVTVVTQFITEDGTDTGALKEIRRHYKQNGKIIQTPTIKVGAASFSSISTEFCQAELDLFKDKTNFLTKGGLEAMDEALTKGVVLVMSLWDDHAAGMLWLDGSYPTDGTGPGVARGTCSKTSGDPTALEKDHGDSSVTFSNIKSGELGSTDGPAPGPAPPSPPSPPTPTPSGCPGGTMQACIGLCPSDPTAFKACVAVCQERCKSEVVV